ncbi:MAG TPA: protein kinase [Polyangiaceae bacterium]|nr:protein kinase [Polyangiaceae bacterium]
MDLPELSTGTQINANVRLVSLLGEGGMGSVWVADHLTLGTQVAVKFLSPSLAKEPASIARFTHEATAAAQIKSPHVVQIFDHGVFAGGLPYMVMELLEGEDLSRRLERTGPLGLGELTRVVVQVCRALSKAHAAGIVHRDIKPDNIFLIDQDGELFVKVLDFGIAKRTNAANSLVVTSTGAMVGTPYYMSPEQMLSSKHVDFRADLWSLGVVSYHCLTGRVPFEGETLGGLCVAIEKGVFELPSRAIPGLTPAIDAWFLRALHRDAASRFLSAREMAESLLEATGRLPAHALGATISPGPRDPMASPPQAGGEAWRAAMATPPVATTKTMPNFDAAPGFVTPPPDVRRPSQRRTALLGALAGVAVTVLGLGAFLFVSGSSETTANPGSGRELGAPPPEAAAPVPLAAPSAPEAAPTASASAAAPAPSSAAAPPVEAPRPPPSARKPPAPRPRPTASFRPAYSADPPPASTDAATPEGSGTPPPRIGPPASTAKPSASAPAEPAPSGESDSP